MKIGVVSDTHRNTGLLVDVADWLIANHGIESLYHLGDDYADAQALDDKGIEIVQVPGIYHPGYHNGTIPRKVWKTPLELRILLVHARERDMNDEDAVSADVVLYGHTHACELRLDEGRLYMNPGHLKGEMDKHMPASFGVLEVREDAVVGEIYNLSYGIISRLELLRSESGLYKAS
jgi:predicted phosphodiesterase